MPTCCDSFQVGVYSPLRFSPSLSYQQHLMTSNNHRLIHTGFSLKVHFFKNTTQDSLSFPSLAMTRSRSFHHLFWQLFALTNENVTYKRFCIICIGELKSKYRRPLDLPGDLGCWQSFTCFILFFRYSHHSGSDRSSFIAWAHINKYKGIKK